MRGGLGCSTALLLACLAASASAARADGPGPLPAGWPSTLKVGVDSPFGDAAVLRGKGPFAMRAQFLDYTSPTENWSTYAPAATFVATYVRESLAQGQTPVFSYYVLKGMTGVEGPAAAATINDQHKAIEYLTLIKLFFQEAGVFGAVPIVLHMEPDFWAFLQEVAPGGDAGRVPARVAATGMPELAGLGDSAAGLAQAIVRLRDRYAPNVVLGWHLSNWGPGFDVRHGGLDAAGVDAVARSLASYYGSFHARFDLTFVDVSEHDAGHWASLGVDRAWDAGVYARQVQMMRTFNRLTGQRFVLWQIPIGNSIMRAINNTPGHWEDNHVQWLLDDPAGRHLAAYLDAGVIALIFGRGSPDDTCACDAARDRVSDSPPSGSHTQSSYSADDDGGLLVKRVTDYVAGGELALPLGAIEPPAPVAAPGGPAPQPAPGKAPSGGRRSAVGSAPRSAAAYVSIRATRRCRRGARIRIRIRMRRLARVARVRILVDGRRRGRVVFGRALRATIVVRGLPRRRHSVTVLVALRDGSSVAITRRYRACAS